MNHILKRLPSGYYYFRPCASEQFAQWPCDRECRPEDCFGWYPADTARRANLAVKKSWSVP